MLLRVVVMYASLLKGIPCRELIMPLCVMVASSTPSTWFVSEFPCCSRSSDISVPKVAVVICAATAW